MNHRCPGCGCTVYGGAWCDRPCWTCEDEVYGTSGWRDLGFWLGLAAGLLYLLLR